MARSYNRPSMETPTTSFSSFPSRHFYLPDKKNYREECEFRENREENRNYNQGNRRYDEAKQSHDFDGAEDNRRMLIPVFVPTFTKKYIRDCYRKLAQSRYRFQRNLANRGPNVIEESEISAKVLQLVTECRYSLTQINGQRKFGPPLDWIGPPPRSGCEIFVGKIPRNLYEHNLYPIFSKVGKIYEMRLMMDFSGMNRGYCFVMYTVREDAVRAIKELNHYEILPGRKIGVVGSINYCRLYVSQLPNYIQAATIVRRIYDTTEEVERVSIYRNRNGLSRYGLIWYKTHRGAAMARRRLLPEAATLFRGGKVNVEWAHPDFYPTNVMEVQR